MVQPVGVTVCAQRWQRPGSWLVQNQRVPSVAAARQLRNNTRVRHGAATSAAQPARALGVSGGRPSLATARTPTNTQHSPSTGGCLLACCCRPWHPPTHPLTQCVATHMHHVVCLLGRERASALGAAWVVCRAGWLAASTHLVARGHFPRPSMGVNAGWTTEWFVAARTHK